MKIAKSLAATIFLLTTYSLLLTTLPGCYTPSHEKEIWDIDTLHRSVEKSQEMIVRIDTTQINEMHEIFIHNTNRLHSVNNTNLTTYDKDFIQQYESLNDIFFQKYKFEYWKYLKEIKHSLTQLDSLKNDIIKGLIPKSTFDRRFRIIKTKTVTLNQEVFMFSKYINNYKTLFNRLDPKIMKIIMSNK